MKVLSLLQPWASLVVMGHKLIETRSFNTKHRGPLLIHASKTKISYKEYKHMAGNFINYLDLESIKKHGDELMVPITGAIIGSVNVVETYTSEYLTDGAKKSGLFNQVTAWENPAISLTDQERAFGDYSPGRYGWLLSDPIQFANPIPCKGDLGIRDILRKSAFAVVEEKEPYEKGQIGLPIRWYMTYYGQKVDGAEFEGKCEENIQLILDAYKAYNGDPYKMPHAVYWWPRILEMEKQLFNPGVASVEQMTSSMNC